MPSEGGPLILPHGGVHQGRAQVAFGSGYSLNLGSFVGLSDNVAPQGYEEVFQNVDLTGIDVLQFTLGFRGAAAPDPLRPSSLIALGHFDGPPIYTVGAWDLAFVRDGGSVTGSAIGSPAIAPGKFGAAVVFNAAEAITWSGAGIVDAMVDKGTASMWWRPDYVGSPAADQFIWSMSNSDSSAANGARIYHDNGGLLFWDVYDSSGVQITGGSRTFSHASGTWYNLAIAWDTTPGTGWGSALFFDGARLGAQVAGTGTRTGDAQYMALGRWQTTTNANNFGVDELRIDDVDLWDDDFERPDAALPESDWVFVVEVSGGPVYYEKISPGDDTVYGTRSINVSANTGMNNVAFKLIAG